MHVRRVFFTDMLLSSVATGVRHQTFHRPHSRGTKGESIALVNVVRDKELGGRLLLFSFQEMCLRRESFQLMNKKSIWPVELASMNGTEALATHMQNRRVVTYFSKEYRDSFVSKSYRSF
jgi:hypothetical protein